MRPGHLRIRLALAPALCAYMAIAAGCSTASPEGAGPRPWARPASARSGVTVDTVASVPRVAAPGRDSADVGGAGQCRVPPVPPDTFPSDYRKHWDPQWDAPRDLLTVMFKPGTTIEQKTRAIAAVRGCVVGGVPTRPGGLVEGFYLIRIKDDGTMGPALRAMSRLDGFPFVATVSPLITVTGASVSRP